MPHPRKLAGRPNRVYAESVKEWLRRFLDPSPRTESSLLRRVLVAIVGGTILVIGLALLVLPGPAVLVIPVGLAVLATEFVWARRLLHRSKNFFRRRPRQQAEPIKE